MLKPTHIAFSVVLLFALSAAAEPTPEIPSLSQEQVAELETGGILVEMNGDAMPPIADAIGIVDAVPDQVFALVIDWANHAEWFDDIEESTVVSQEADGHGVLSGINGMPWPMEDRTFSVASWDRQQEVDGVPAWVSSWDYIPDSGNMVDTEGYWLLIPWGDDGSRTLVRYYMTFDLGTPMPDFLLNWGTESMLPSRIQVLRDRL